ncbi:MAG: PilZ domain-containing protein [Candidatus Binatia bacterium]
MSTETPDVIFSAVIKGRESQVQMWTESVEVVSASSSGLGFYAKHKCFVGQVLSLMMPMPIERRRYDTNKRLYKIWGLVQHCHVLAEDSYHIGVAFIGPSAPESYYAEPMTSYRVSGIGSDGFWIASESETPFKPRKYTRFQGTVEVHLTTFNADGSERSFETAFTENISETGAAVFSDMPLDVGELVRCTSGEHQFQATAMVRNRQYGRDDRQRLHLEFVDALFPVSQLTSEK